MPFLHTHTCTRSHVLSVPPILCCLQLMASPTPVQRRCKMPPNPSRSIFFLLCADITSDTRHGEVETQAPRPLWATSGDQACMATAPAYLKASASAFSSCCHALALQPLIYNVHELFPGSDQRGEREESVDSDSCFSFTPSSP